jgi:hypothetical protein
LTATARREFTDEFKREAVGLLATSGRPLSQTAQEVLGVPLRGSAPGATGVTGGRGIWASALRERAYVHGVGWRSRPENHRKADNRALLAEIHRGNAAHWGAIWPARGPCNFVRRGA